MIIVSANKDTVINFDNIDALWLDGDTDEYGSVIFAGPIDGEDDMAMGEYESHSQALKAMERLADRIEEALRLDKVRVNVPTKDELY